MRCTRTFLILIYMSGFPGIPAGLDRPDAAVRGVRTNNRDNLAINIP